MLRLFFVVCAAMAMFVSGHAAQTRDGAPPRDLSAPRDAKPPRDGGAPKSMAIDGAKVAAEPAPDLYPEAGGFDPEDGTSMILLVGNKGNAGAAATHVRIYMRMEDQDAIKQEYPIAALKPGEFYELHVPSIIPVAWLRTLYARIDQPAAVAEIDERNNAFDFLKRNRESEIQYDIASGALYSRPDGVEPVDAASGLSSGKRLHKSLTATKTPAGDAPSDFADAPTGPRVKCVGETGNFACTCGDTPAAVCTDKLQAANCKDHFDIDGLLPPGGYTWTCPGDQSD